MNLRIFNNRSSFGFYSPQRKIMKSTSNLNEIDKCKDEILKLKIELNKRYFDYQELKVEYNKLDKAYKSNIILLEKLINEANNNIIDNLSYDNEREKEKENYKELINIKKINSPKNISKSIDSKNNLSYNSNLKSKNIFLSIANRNHLNLKLQQEIVLLKNEIKEKDNIINNLKNNANILKYKELDKKLAKIFAELIQTREKNEKLDALNINLQSKLNFYKETSKKKHNKYKQIENENEYLKKKIYSLENKEDNLINTNNINQTRKNNNKDEEIKNLKEKVKLLEEENKNLNEKIKGNDINEKNTNNV